MSIRQVAIVGISLIAMAQAGSLRGSASTKIKDPASSDTILREQFCQIYYQGAPTACTRLRDRVIANHSRALPTLELGDPAKPPMFFIHGWPDTAGMWANQFEKFCDGPDAEYFCVAATWFNFHADVPAITNRSQLLWDIQVDAFHSVMAEMNLEDVTLVFFDFGAVIGYQFTYKYPELIKSVIAMDIGMGVASAGSVTFSESIPKISEFRSYQQTNIRAFLTANNTLERGNINPAAPCKNCNFGANVAYIAWPYYQSVNNKTGERWPQRVSSIPRSQWQLSLIPRFPDGIPLLFMYGECNVGTGYHGAPACVPRTDDFFFRPEWLEWVNEQGKKDGKSQVISVRGDGHWFQCRAPSSDLANTAMQSWLSA